MANSTDLGLDTSVVVRLLVGEPAELTKAAVSEIEKARKNGSRIMISDLVVAETYFALQAAYQVPKKEAIEALFQLFNSGDITPEPGGCAPEILRTFRNSSSKPGFVDRLIHAGYEKNNAGMLTCEKAAKKLPHTHIIQPQ